MRDILVSSNQSLTQFANKSTAEDVVTKEEMFFAMFVAEHNSPFFIADHFTHLSSAVFTDSKITKAYSSASSNSNNTSIGTSDL